VTSPATLAVGAMALVAAASAVIGTIDRHIAPGVAG
jgi:hypothetical protein